ncbi:MAG TPA: nucleoside deaminase [Candidatus Avalokitesvara rifleensis]|uniref:nucleoside deaminase n=1 Tax=Candidatus Avalokitesvara rifleensis TaxID=3367620 RepID=UPI002712C6BD|nr:nucleoside deaminase [Candidatus Brocadiales bacterium]
MSTTDIKYMRMAIDRAIKGVLKGQTPFGAIIVKKGQVLVCEHNTVWKDCDITAHAEMRAVRRACRKLNTIDLTGSTLYSTCEPCPMCLGAVHWAGVSRVVFGCRIRDAKKMGFSELTVSAARLKSLGNSPVKVTGGVLREECIDVMKLWEKLGGRPY